MFVLQFKHISKYVKFLIQNLIIILYYFVDNVVMCNKGYSVKILCFITPPLPSLIMSMVALDVN